MKKKFIGVCTAASLVLISLFAVPTLGNSSTNSKNVTVISGGEVVGQFYTNKKTVDEFLDENDIELKDNQSVVYDYADNIVDGSTIIIDEAITIDLNIDNRITPYKTTKGAEVKDIIKDLSLRDGVDYYYIDGDSSDKLEEGKQISLLSRSDETFKTTEVVPFKTVYKDTTDLAEGVTEVVSEGVDGEKVVSVKVVFYGGEEYLRKTISEVVTLAPVDKVVKRGVAKSVKTSQGDLKYSKVINMSASAYTAGPESTGKNPGDAGYGITATGAKARRGVVAVDPNVIPLGTKLYVEGYGVCVAADTGGAIKGNKIDLCYDSLSDALQFGRRNVKVYVLK